MGGEREFGSQALRQRGTPELAIGKRAGPKRLERRPRRAPPAQAPVVEPRLRLGSFGSLMRAGLARGAQFA